MRDGDPCWKGALFTRTGGLDIDDAGAHTMTGDGPSSRGGRRVAGGMRRRAVRWLDLPAEVLLDVPRIEAVGRFQVRLTNHRGLERFEANQVVIRLPGGEGRVIIGGRDLVIGWISPEELLVTGQIIEIQFAGVPI